MKREGRERVRTYEEREGAQALSKGYKKNNEGRKKKEKREKKRRQKGNIQMFRINSIVDYAIAHRSINRRRLIHPPRVFRGEFSARPTFNLYSTLRFSAVPSNRLTR